MKRPEQTLQIQVARYLALALKPPTIWTAIGHGGGGKVRGAILKAMGVQAGWPDILIVWPENGYCKMLGIELKAGKGRPSPAQVNLSDAFYQANGIYEVCRSLDEVDHQLYMNRIPRHASLGSERTKITRAAT